LEIILAEHNETPFSIQHQPEQVLIGLIPLKEVKLDKPLNRLIKRSVDLLLGGSILLISFPVLFPIVAILIKLESKGPVFFIQKRTGLNGKSFYCYKFRTMVVNKDADRLQVQPGDKRITRFGHFLRNYYFDEVPQLINVVIGNMSLVGPRPLMLRHTVLYSRIVKNYHDRHRVKPGMTGLAQMRGYHGTIANKQDLYNRCISDIEYIQNWSLFGDLYIFFGTIIQTGVKLLWKRKK
jgi:putative colanic acid biosysnthesis UDP-glucose lipid carrier transferase